MNTYEPAGTKYVPAPDGTACAGAATEPGWDVGTCTVAEAPTGTVTRNVSWPPETDQSLTALPYGVSYADFADVNPPPGCGAMRSAAYPGDAGESPPTER
ncbi:hypothetical protein M8542_04350 [Amycolatopsis sp. OK19-0408]|uniref:Uncharacterized protein n=1 Tax=Amycolatopsis iheyensis TaxID=2945988 RepID=A0A9X2SH50_9PSEU|nr:hypothetical protein [Amycolatopsis iheyensis]